MCFGFATGFHLFHFWGSYEAPKQVSEFRGGGGPTVAQKRECRRCGAVDYRRVGIHN